MARAIGHFVRCSFVLFFQSTNWRRFVGVSSLTFALGLNRFCKMIHYSSLMWFSFNQNWFRLTLSSELATNNNMSHQMRYGRFVFFFTGFYLVLPGFQVLAPVPSQFWPRIVWQTTLVLLCNELVWQRWIGTTNFTALTQFYWVLHQIAVRTKAQQL